MDNTYFAEDQYKPEYRPEIWAAWEITLKNEKIRAQDRAYTELNNLYLSIERKEVKLNVRNANYLRTLVGQAYDPMDSMIGYWVKEFQKLPNWLNV